MSSYLIVIGVRPLAILKSVRLDMVFGCLGRIVKLKPGHELFVIGQTGRTNEILSTDLTKTNATLSVD